MKNHEIEQASPHKFKSKRSMKMASPEPPSPTNSFGGTKSSFGEIESPTKSPLKIKDLKAQLDKDLE